MGVLRWLKEGEVTKWLSGASFVVKPWVGLWLVTDLVHLNQVVKVPTQPFAAVQDILNSLGADAKFSSTLDCKLGYWQIALCPKSQQLVAFLTKWGTLTYLRKPMGLTSSGDIFCHRTDEPLAGIPGVQKLVNNGLVMGSTMKQLMGRVLFVFDACYVHHNALG